MSSSEQTPKSSMPRMWRKGLKVANACQSCRVKKTKCDGIRPICGNCQRKPSLRGTCTYTRGIASPNGSLGLPVQTSQTSSPHSSLPLAPVAATEQLDADDDTRAHLDGANGVFAGEVTSAIGAKFGFRSGGILNLVPLANAPLFGILHHTQAPNRGSYHLDRVLPPRKHADKLVGLYWRHLQTLEPLVDEESFTHSYQALFAGSSLGMDERVFLAILNTVFAHSTQLQEWIPFEEREEASNTYFNRAWTLLNPAITAWEPGSIETVQCLLLMTRYLQCTDNLHQTWMTISSAVAMAQNLGLHKPQTSDPSSPSSRKKGQVWKCCVFIHRVVTWALGRTALGAPVMVADFLYDAKPEEPTCAASDVYFTKSLEIYEITNHIILFQNPSGSSLGDKLGLPRPYPNDDCYSTALKLDGYLNKWHNNLPRYLAFDTFQGDVNDDTCRHAFILHLRYLHSKIFLFRPMLARLCLSQSHQPPASSAVTHISLGHHALRDCAAICVEVAQRMIDAFLTVPAVQQSEEGTIGVLPWWLRFSYFYSAATVLIAAMLRGELFTPAVAQCWSRAMQALRAHEHLNPFVHQCVTVFQTLSDKILETHPGGSHFPPPEGLSSTYFQDCFQEIGLEPDNFLFGIEDVSWLDPFAEQ